MCAWLGLHHPERDEPRDVAAHRQRDVLDIIDQVGPRRTQRATRFELEPRSNVARRDAAPVDCSGTFTTDA